MRRVILDPSLVARMSRKRFIKQIQQANSDQPEDNACGNTVFLGYFFVEAFVLLLFRILIAHTFSSRKMYRQCVEMQVIVVRTKFLLLAKVKGRIKLEKR
jgi:hypothetical protein